MVPSTTTVTELCYFLEFCFSSFFFFLMENAGCVSNFAQMTAEPRKAVDDIDV